MSNVIPPRRARMTPGDAATLNAGAQLRRANAETEEDPTAAGKLHAEADHLDAVATCLRDPATFGLPELRPGRGGEISPLPDPQMPLAIREVAETVQSRSEVLAAEATMSRLGLAREAGVLTEAVEAAESVGAEGALEQMLVHGVTAAHRVSMRLLAAADTSLRMHERDRVSGSGTALVEAGRSATAAARVMDSMTRAAAALNRMRHGGRQQVTVQYVHVEEGAQAVVAAKVEAGSKSPVLGRGRRRGRGPK